VPAPLESDAVTDSQELCARSTPAGCRSGTPCMLSLDLAEATRATDQS
jgi:hypothetical protein